MTRIAKAFFFGRKGRKALRSHVKRALDAHAKTGREHGFHAGKAGVDRTLQRGKTGSIRWSPRAAVGQMLRGGALHHTHPKGRGSLSPRDLRSVVTSQNSKGGRNTLWAHSPDGHEAARLTRRAAGQPVKQRRKMFADAYRATRAGSGGAYGHGQRLRRELKRRGLIHSGSTVRKMSELIETDEPVEGHKANGRPRIGGIRLVPPPSANPLAELDAAIEKAKGLIRGGSRKTLRRIADRAHKDPKNSRLARAYRYMAHRNPSERKGVYKSALSELDAAIEKARGMIPGGSKRMLRSVMRRGKGAKGPTGSEWGLKGRQRSEGTRTKDAAHYLRGRYTRGWRPGSSRKFSDIRSGRYK